jgi:hypothetical protein
MFIRTAARLVLLNVPVFLPPFFGDIPSYAKQLKSQFHGGSRMNGLSLGLATTLAVLAPALLSAQVSDTTPPTLLSFTVSPSSINTTLSAQTVTVTAVIVDDISGVDSNNTLENRVLTVTAYTPSGIPRGTSFLSPLGPPSAHTYSADAPFPQFSLSGTWNYGIHMQDNAGNMLTLTPPQIQALGLAGSSTSVQVTSNPDTQPPQVTSFAFNPSPLDVSSGARTSTTLTIGLTDNLSGVCFGCFFPAFLLVMKSPSGQQFRFIDQEGFIRASGSNLSGTWQATLPMPQYSEPGAWTLQSFEITDRVLNVVTYTGSTLQNQGLATNLTVVSSPADTTSPQLTGFSFSPAFIDTSLGPQTVNYTITATDDLSGVDFSPDTPTRNQPFGVVFKSPSGNQTQMSDFLTTLPTLSGTPLSGTWTGTLTFPQFSEAGTWNVTSLAIKDKVRNLTVDNASQLQTMHLPTTLTIIKPSLMSDGSVGPTGGIVEDSVFGSRAELTVPPGVLSTSTMVAIDVLQSPISLPMPMGFSTLGTYYVNIQLTPEPSFPLPAPGIVVILPLPTFKSPGTFINLFRVDAATGTLVPELDSLRNPISGLVGPSGLFATFIGVTHFSTLVGLLPDSIPVTVSVQQGFIDIDSEGAVGVAILGGNNFDVATIVPASVEFGPKGAKNKGTPVLKDVNHDGKLDLILYFAPDESGIPCGATSVSLSGMTVNQQAFSGTENIQTTHTFSCPRP